LLLLSLLLLLLLLLLKTKKRKHENMKTDRCGKTRRQKWRAKGSGKEVWNLKCTVIPVIIGATGMVTRSLRKNLEYIPGKHSID